jgi:hypothetical protein
MKSIIGFRRTGVLAALAGLTITCAPAIAETDKRPECQTEPVSIWYVDNPQASGGLYSNPWADCRLSANPR